MKFILIYLLILCCAKVTYGQGKIDKIKSSESIPISDIKTTHIIFKEKIKYLDIGSRYFVADTIENMVKVKHIGQGFTDEDDQKNSNITIITKSGNYYSIPLFFMRDVTTTTYKIDGAENNINKQAINGNKKHSPEEMFELCHLSKRAMSKFEIKENQDLLLTKVSGLFYREEYFIIRVTIKNFSTIDFDIDNILFRFLKKNKLAQNAIYQERVLHPIKSCNNNTKVKGNGDTQTYSFVFEKFTPNFDEKLQVDILEKNGGRSTVIKIPRKKLINPDVL